MTRGPVATGLYDYSDVTYRAVKRNLMAGSIQIMDADCHIREEIDVIHDFFARAAQKRTGFVERKYLPADLTHKILWKNPLRLYGI